MAMNWTHIGYSEPCRMRDWEGARRDIRAVLSEWPAKWTVESWTNPKGAHVVRLDAYGGHGSCTCKNFAIAIEPLIRAKGLDAVKTRFCRHQRAVRHYFHTEALKEIGKL